MDISNIIKEERELFLSFSPLNTKIPILVCQHKKKEEYPAENKTNRVKKVREIIQAHVVVMYGILFLCLVEYPGAKFVHWIAWGVSGL